MNINVLLILSKKNWTLKGAWLNGGIKIILQEQIKLANSLKKKLMI